MSTKTMTPQEAQELIRNLCHRIEDVLDGSHADDGWVNPGALNRLWECYQGEIKPLGLDRMPEIPLTVDTGAQSLYEELYGTLMSESAWEACDELRARYPQYEARRTAADET